MSPEAIHSLIGLFGVERGLHILNFWTATDTIEMTRQHRNRPIRERPDAVDRDLNQPAVEGCRCDT